MEGQVTQAIHTALKLTDKQMPEVGRQQETAPDLNQRMARRAFDFYVERGKEEGHALAD
jgi:hypothetical protein